MTKKSQSARQHWPTFPVPLLGIAIGVLLFIAVGIISPHPGQSCGRLGQISEEWELGMPSRPLICSAMLDGDLRYDRAITSAPMAMLR